MKAGTKRQERVVAVDERLPEITPKQRDWAFEHVLPHTGVRRKSGDIICLDCAHVWRSEFKHEWVEKAFGTTCPKCKRKLKVKNTRKSVNSYEGYCTILDRIEEFQVIRKFHVRVYVKAKEPKRNYWYEVSRIYIDEKGNHEIIGYTLTQGWYGDRWTNGFCLKHPKTLNRHDFKSGKMYPYKKILPILRRNGFKGNDKNLPMISLMKGLLNSHKVETLWKVKRFDFLEHYLKDSRGEQIEEFWPQVKLAIKHNYQIKDMRNWFDLLSMLRRFNKDIMSVRYIFPLDFHKEHNKYVERRRKLERKMELKELKSQLAEDQKKYIKLKRRFFGLRFEDNDLIIEPIKSVQQLMAESDMLRHCAYQNKYHRRERSLLLTARVDNKPVETIEVNIARFYIDQARGYLNESSKYHKRILALVDANMDQIKACTVVKRARKPKTQIRQSA